MKIIGLPYADITLYRGI